MSYPIPAQPQVAQDHCRYLGVASCSCAHKLVRRILELALRVANRRRDHALELGLTLDRDRRNGERHVQRPDSAGKARGMRMHAESAGTHGQGPEHGRAGASVLASTGTRAYASSTPQKQPSPKVAIE